MQIFYIYILSQNKWVVQTVIGSCLPCSVISLPKHFNMMVLKLKVHETLTLIFHLVDYNSLKNMFIWTKKI